MDDQVRQIQEAIVQSRSQNQALNIIGGNSKSFYARPVQAKALHVGEYKGIVNYIPEELVVTARCGTRLDELDATLGQSAQMLAFEPPHFSLASTLGGTIACGFSGPRRAYVGSARDFVLGVLMINGDGKIMRFGGEVMKNVAGYDVSRLVVGSLGTLGVILEISLKVLPRPEIELTLMSRCSAEQAIQMMNQLPVMNVPVSATFYDGANLYIRLSGVESAVRVAVNKVPADLIDADDFWSQVRDLRHGFFQQSAPLWRLSVPADTRPLFGDHAQCIEWGGALRWLVSDSSADEINHSVGSVGGYATLFRGGGNDIFQRLDDRLLPLYRRLKQAFDPQGLFNPGKMYPHTSADTIT